MWQHGQLMYRQLRRCLHITNSQWKLCHYQSLEIPKSSTQNEIKAAYYKLSMIYHPDRNKGSESAAKKFREITQAYEILGNYRLRRLYDKGIVHTAGSQYAQDIRNINVELEEEDDPQTKFYKSRFTKTKIADAKGRNPIYNFDEWARVHYGNNFARRQEAQAKYERIRKQKESNRLSIQNDFVMLAFLFAGVSVYLMFVAESSYDTPKSKALDRHKEALARQATKVEKPIDK